LYKILAKPFFMGKRVVYMPSCHSTNEVASDLLKKGRIEEGTIVITDNQTKGRGQQGNHWEAEEGKNITCSLILRPKALPTIDQFVLNIIASLGVADIVREVLSIDTEVKWPNDVYCEGQKISGILINNFIKRSSIESAVIGIGLNVNQNSFEYEKATSLSLLSGNNTYDLPQILESLILSIEKRYFQWKNHRETLWNDYLDRMYWYGEVRTYKANNRFFTGIIRGVTKAGRLILEGEEKTSEYDFKAIEFVE